MLIDRSSLAAVHATAKEKTRYAIQHVHVAADGTTASTDGRMLISVQPPKDALNGVRLPKDGTLLSKQIAQQLTKELKPTKGNYPTARIVSYESVPAGPDKMVIEAGSNGSTVRHEVETPDGRFPDYQQVVPEPNSTSIRLFLSIAQMQDFIKTFADMTKAGDVHRPHLELFVTPGTKPVLARCKIDNAGRRAVGVIMPVMVEQDNEPNAWEQQHLGLKRLKVDPANDNGIDRKDDDAGVEAQAAAQTS